MATLRQILKASMHRLTCSLKTVVVIQTDWAVPLRPALVTPCQAGACALPNFGDAHALHGA